MRKPLFLIANDMPGEKKIEEVLKKKPLYANPLIQRQINEHIAPHFEIIDKIHPESKEAYTADERQKVVDAMGKLTGLAKTFMEQALKEHHGKTLAELPESRSLPEEFDFEKELDLEGFSKVLKPSVSEKITVETQLSWVPFWGPASYL